MRIAYRIATVSLAAALLAGAAGHLLGVCGPFSDTAGDSFCPFVLEIFYMGITTGTTPTTFDPTGNVTRLQMAAFLSRTVDGVLKRGSGDAALKKFWTTQGEAALGVTTVGTNPVRVESDGLDIWVSQLNSVSRVRASDGRLLETWTGASTARSILSTMGRIFVTSLTTPGRLYRIDPSQTAGAVTTVSSTLGIRSDGITFDGSRIWTANLGDGTPNTGSVSIVTPGATIPFTVTTVTTGFSEPQGALYDGANVWVTDQDLNRLFKLDASGAILQTVTVGTSPEHAVFDGTNIWVPNVVSSSVTVVRASNGVILATLTGNGLSSPSTAAFDGLRVLVTNSGGHSVSLWKAADLSAIGSSPTGNGTSPTGACSDGIQFWIALFGSGKLARL